MRTLPMAGLLVVALATARAQTRQVAVVMGGDHPRFRAAIAGMQRIPGVIPNVFDLSRGTNEVDRALDALRRFPFDGVVALGLPAHEFCLRSGQRRPYTVTLVADARLDHPAFLDPEPGAEEWAGVLEQVLPRKAVLAAFVSSAAEERRLADLSARLAAGDRRLVVARLEPGRSPTRAVREALETSGAAAVFLPEDWGLIRQREAFLHLLQRAHALAIPVFSGGLTRRYAVLALYLPDETVGELAARRCLGLAATDAGSAARVEVNQRRAVELGLRIPPELLRRAAGSP